MVLVLIIFACILFGFFTIIKIVQSIGDQFREKCEDSYNRLMYALSGSVLNMVLTVVCAFLVSYNGNSNPYLSILKAMCWGQFIVSVVSIVLFLILAVVMLVLDYKIEYKDDIKS